MTEAASAAAPKQPRLAGQRELIRRLKADPEHAPERLVLYAQERQAGSAAEWAAAQDAESRTTRVPASLSSPDGEPPADPRPELIAHQRIEMVRTARFQGALAGTPFFIALVPAYVSFLLNESRFLLRTAALAGEDPSHHQRAAEILYLRGLYPNPGAARNALDHLEVPRDVERNRREKLRTWIRLVYQLLLLGGFMSAGDDERSGPSTRRARIARAPFFVGSLVVWLLTWVVPFTLMVVMSWSCESNARTLGRKAEAFYGLGGADPASSAGTRTRRDVVRGALLVLSLGVPLVFLAIDITVLNGNGADGWHRILGALVALSLAVALIVRASRR